MDDDAISPSPDVRPLQPSPVTASPAAEAYRRLGIWKDETVTDWLRKWAVATPDAPAVRFEGGDVSYGEIWNGSLRLANELLRLGLRKGDVVAIQLPNVPDFMTIYFAVTMMGGVVSTLHTPYRGGEMAPLLRHAGARAVVCGPASESYDAPSTMLGLREKLPALDHVIVAGPNAPAGTLALTTLIANGTTSPVADPPDADDPAILCFTSGTSASPKAVVHSYRTLLSNNRIAAPIYELTADDVVLGGPPFTHAFGICVLNFTVMAGACALLMPHFTPSALMNLIERGRPTVLFVAPAHVAACQATGLLDKHDLSSVRIATISGSACAPELAYGFEAALPNGRVGQMWGMTECFMGLHTPFDAPASVRCETLGGPTPTFELRLTAPDGSPVPDGEEGELTVRGCSVISGYLGNEEATRASFGTDGWFRTGDLATRDGNGNVRLTGRVKDVINRGGIKINPADIEALIDRHPSVLMSAIAPVPDEVLGERACLYVQMRPDAPAPLTLDEACAWLARHDVAKMKWPERIVIVDQMPMTPTRKIVKGALRPHADP